MESIESKNSWGLWNTLVGRKRCATAYALPKWGTSIANENPSPLSMDSIKINVPMDP
jgi:hypothetical protein